MAWWFKQLFKQFEGELTKRGRRENERRSREEPFAAIPFPGRSRHWRSFTRFDALLARSYCFTSRGTFAVVPLPGRSRLWRSFTRLRRFLSALNTKLLKNRQATQASTFRPLVSLRAQCRCWRHSGESARLKPILARVRFWPGRCHMWIEFVVSSRLSPRVFLRVVRFSSLHKIKNQDSKFQDSRRNRKKTS